MRVRQHAGRDDLAGQQGRRVGLARQEVHEVSKR
jgi:hypothetical protein